MPLKKQRKGMKANRNKDITKKQRKGMKTNKKQDITLRLKVNSNQPFSNPCYKYKNE